MPQTQPSTEPSELDLLSHLSEVQDPRSRSCWYPIEELLLAGLAGVASGAEDWVYVCEWAHTKLDWLRNYLPFANGIASHDTFSRVFGLIDAKQFEACFTKMMMHLCPKLEGHFLAIDGKALRGSHDGARAMTHLVAIRDTATGMVLAQTRVADKSNEITAIPELIEVLDLKGATVTMDAMGAQTKILSQLADKGAHVLVALKNNQSAKAQAVEELFELVAKSMSGQAAQHTDVDKGHSRVEQRSCTVLKDLSGLGDALEAWPSIKSVIRVESHTQWVNGRKKGQSSKDRRYYVSSLELGAQAFNTHIREHWHIENSMHWVLDVAFKEDDCRIRVGEGAQNFAVLRRMALNMIKNDRLGLKIGVKGRRLCIGWDTKVLARLLGLPEH
jgi:predicted transposase YbfD/YdcC